MQPCNSFGRQFLLLGNDNFPIIAAIFHSLQVGLGSIHKWLSESFFSFFLKKDTVKSSITMYALLVEKNYLGELVRPL